MSRRVQSRGFPTYHGQNDTTSKTIYASKCQLFSIGTTIYSMPSQLIKNTHLLVTMDDKRREIADGGLLVRNNVIEAVGKSADLESSYRDVDEVIDLTGHIVLPGLVNTHH